MTGDDPADASDRRRPTQTSARRWPANDLLAHRVATTPERTALVDADTGRWWTYRDLDDAVARTAAGLRTLGVDRGDRIATALDTGVAAASLSFATMRLGATLVALDPSRPAEVRASMVDRTTPAVVVDGPSVGEATPIAPPDATSPRPERVVVDDPTRPAGASLATDEADGDGPDDRRGHWRADDTAVVLFTSGTTGEAKGVRLTHGNLLASAVASALRLGVLPGDRWFDPLPTYHMGGFAPLVRSTFHGTAVVLQSDFDAAVASEAMATHDATCASMVPTMVSRLLDAGWTPPDGFRFVLLGGAPTPPDLVDRCAERGVPVCPTYGMTETASQVATAPFDEARDYRGTVGRPLLFTEVAILDDEGNAVDPGGRGELVVSGPTVTPGYLDDGATDGAFSDRGFHTGDVGYRDGDGRLWVVGRVDDMVVTGGENVYPSTVEAVVRDVDAVDDVVVLGLPDPEWGERVAALVAGETTPDAVRRACRDRLAPHEVPKTVRVVDRLPRTASGTVDRGAARELLDDGDADTDS